MWKLYKKGKKYAATPLAAKEEYLTIVKEDMDRLKELRVVTAAAAAPAAASSSSNNSGGGSGSLNEISNKMCRAILPSITNRRMVRR